MAVALAALDVVIKIHGPDGKRAIPLTELYRLPGDEPDRDMLLGHGELITAVHLPDLPLAARSTYRKVRDRASYASRWPQQSTSPTVSSATPGSP
jgi:xanthine dehydrogenase YagS FAD-binding subunit